MSTPYTSHSLPRQRFAIVVKAYRTRQSLTLREFAEQLSQDPAAEFTYQTVLNWETGAAAPSPLTLIAISTLYHDWRKEFALDCLAAIRPDAFLPVAEIGRNVLAAGAEPQPDLLRRN